MISEQMFSSFILVYYVTRFYVVLGVYCIYTDLFYEQENSCFHAKTEIDANIYFNPPACVHFETNLLYL